MLIRIIIIAFMVIVCIAGVYQFFSAYFGAGRTGNYLKIRSRGERSAPFSYRILPVYKLIFRRMKILYIIAILLHALLPLFFAFGFCVFILISDKLEWWEKDKNGSKESVFLIWSESGYSIKIFVLIILISIAILLFINALIFPLIFDFVTGLF